MDETEVVYGIIGTVPRGEFDPNVKYELLNLVSYDGSSYVAHTDPPLGTLPTNTDYWQISASGTGKATASTPGTVMPDGVTTEVDSNGALSVKTATQSTAGIVKGSAGIKVAEDGSIDVNTLFEQATELANIIAGEAISTALGKIAKSIAVTMGLNENALLKNMLTNMDANDQNKIPTSAFVHKLYERIGMGEDLDIGDNLTAVVKSLNSNLADLGNNKANKTDVHELFGTNANGASLLNWASDEAKRLSIWKTANNTVADFPDDSEWCALNLQDSQNRGIVVAFKYAGDTSVKYRCYFNKSWFGEWKTIV